VPVDRGQRVSSAWFRLHNQLPQTLANGTVRNTPMGDNVNWNARNFFRGPGNWNVDASVFKHILFTERYRLRLTFDFFNVLNHPLDNEPNATTGLQDLSTQANGPRIIGSRALPVVRCQVE
jgi:hypothetical protein